MADGVTEITTRRGYDIRDFSLLACGGGGALCGAFMAELLHTKNVLIPEFAASFCAWSMFCLDVGRDYIRTYISKIDKADTAAINRLYEEMADEALMEFKALHVTREQMNIVKSVDTRYLGQFHEIEMKLPEGEISASHLEDLKQEFHKKHKELFTFSLPDGRHRDEKSSHDRIREIETYRSSRARKAGQWQQILEEKAAMFL